MTPPAPVPAASGEPLLTIGELLARLSPDFPDVSHSKVRFLEDRGLVTPARTKSGYRKFSAADVERLRVVLTLQRDQYLPLRVIRDHLAARDAGHDLPLPTGPGRSPADERQAAPPALEPSEPPAPVAPVGHVGHVGQEDARREPGGHDDGGGPVGPVLRAAVVEAAGGSLALVEALEDHGLLPRESAGLYPAAAADLVRAARVLADHGVEPRHLRALRTAVGHEAALVEQVVSPLRRQRSPEAGGGRARAVGDELVASMLALHAAALGCALDEVPSRG